MKTLKELIFEQLAKDRTILKELYEPYSKEDVAHLATALERMRWNRADKPGLFAVQWLRNMPWNETGKRSEIVIDFFIKDRFMNEFSWNEQFDKIDLQEEEALQKMRLDALDYHCGLALAMHNLHAKPVKWSTLALTALLSAKVPYSYETRYEPIAKTFLQVFFKRCIETRERLYKQPAPAVKAAEREMTIPEMQQVIRDCVVFNRISLAQTLHSAYAELALFQKE